MGPHKKIFPIFLFLALLILPGNSFADTTATITVTATILPGQNSISLDASLVDFGGVSGSVSDRRFISLQAVVVSYFAASNPWTIRVYTANPGDVTGLIGVTNPAESIPLKVWCDNYGPRENPVGNAPDEENRYFWSGYDFNGDLDKEDVITDGSISEIALGFDVNGDGDAMDTGLGTAVQPVSENPTWLRVPDDSEMLPGNPFTWRRLSYAGAELEADGFPAFFAIDVTGVLPQDYQTTTLTFQIINE
ncbi:MAG: hypothetical protein HQ547_04980 [Candidatus Omnitrophica bacterium]|nr:hypothetical protein [Candidatus Omnitrophota bacterium]